KLGSGGAFKLASEQISSSRCYVINGDIMCNSNLTDMVTLHNESKALATMFLVPMRSPYGVVEVKNSFITKFVEKPLLPSVHIHGGINIIEQKIFGRFPDKGQMEDTIFVELAAENKFAAYIGDKNAFWDSIDSEKDFENANINWPGI
ncbi:MAG: nucleotidyltransferase family protein, partial [Candidatus Kariarchaeaceae archaeon]